MSVVLVLFQNSCQLSGSETRGWLTNLLNSHIIAEGEAALDRRQRTDPYGVTSSTL